MTRERVIQRLDLLSRKVEADKKWTAAVQAERLLGMEVGMFIPRPDDPVKWDGDLSKLSADQFAKFRMSVEQMVYGDDKERLAADKEAFLREHEARKAAESAAALQ